MKYIKGFDGLRAISILFVLLTHLGIFDLVQDIPFLKDNFNLYSGGTGVMIFFTISGFLITSLLIREKSSNGTINLKKFFIRRFLRLLPPLLLFYGAMLVLMIFGLLPPTYVALLISFFYLYNFVPFSHYVSELGHTWSLAVEEQFYFFWPFVIKGLKNIKGSIIVALLIIISCIAWNFVSSTPFMMHGKMTTLPNCFFVGRWFIPACLPIMIGSLTSMILFSNLSYVQNKFANNYYILVLSVLFFFAQLYIPNLPYDLISVLQPIGITLFLVWIYFNQDTFIVNVLEFKPVAFIGKISYGIYVYQGLFLRTGPGGDLAIQKYPLNIFLVFVSAILSYYLLEKKVMAYKNKFRV